jgi:hypothetical protein
MRPLLSTVAAAILVLTACGGGGGIPQTTDESSTTGDIFDTGGSEATGGAIPELSGSNQDSSSGSPAMTLVQGPAVDLIAVLQSSKIVAQGSNGFVEPTADQRINFQRAFERALQAPQNAAAELVPLGFGVRFLKDIRGSSFVVIEDQQNRGAGTFVINLSPARDVVLEAPHADFDKGTGRQTSEQLVLLGVRALFLTGSHRCANEASTPCSTGTTAVCGGRMRNSDVAHNTNTYFMAAHLAARDLFPDALAISVHGMEGSSEELGSISDGTNQIRTGTSVTLRDALNRAFATQTGRVFSCNAASDSEQATLCGTTNVQGRFDNLAPDACQSKASTGYGRFVHLEQSPPLRDPANTPKVAQAMADVIPCTLQGPGLNCGR